MPLNSWPRTNSSRQADPLEAPGNFVLEDRPDPNPGTGQLLLRPAYTAVCFSRPG